MENIFNSNTLLILADINFWYVFLPLTVGLLRFKRFSKIQRLIFYVVILAACNDIITISLREQKLPHLWVLHVYIPILFFLMLRIYRNGIPELINNTVLKVLLVVFVLASLVNSFFIQNYDGWPSNMIFIGSICYILLSVTYFYSLLRKLKLQPLEKEPLFWLNAGVLLYNASTILLFLFILNILKGQTVVTNIAFSLNMVFNMVLLTSYTLALWVKPLR